jgi:hypothetical protein
MDQETIIQYITDTFAGVEVLRPTDGPGAGDTFFFTASQRDVDPTRRMPFATIVINATEISPDAARGGVGAGVRDGCVVGRRRDTLRG